MTSTVINNSEAVHKYRGQIENAIEELKNNFKKTEQAIETVGESWKDDNFREFQDNFNEDKEKILPLCDVLNNYQSNLLYQLEEKIKRLEGRSFRL